MRLSTCFFFAVTVAGARAATGCADQAFTSVAVDASATDASDATVVSDGGADAGGFCEALTPVPAFCADFDDGNSVQAGWSRSGTLPPGSGELSVDTAQSKSPPASLLAQSAGDGGNSQTWLIHDLAAPLNGNVTLDYDVFIENVANAFDVKLSALYFGELGKPGDYTVFFSAKSSGSAILERMPAVDGGTIGPFHVTSATLFPLPARWTHVAIAFDFRKPTPTLKVDLDGQPAIAERELAKGFYRGLKNMQIGMPFSEGVTGRIALRIDNVVLRLEP